MPKKRSTKANGHRKTASKARATPSPSPTATPAATDINPAPQAADAVPLQPEPEAGHEPSNEVEAVQDGPQDVAQDVVQSSAASTTTETTSAASVDGNTEDSTVLVERPDDSHNDSSVVELAAAESAVQQALAEEEQAAQREIADELVDMVQSFAESEAERIDASVASSDGDFTTMSEINAEVAEIAQEAAQIAQETAALESVLLTSGNEASVQSPGPVTPPRLSVDTRPDQKLDDEHTRADSAPPHLRRAASTSFVASALSTSPGSHGRSAHKHLRFTSADEGDGAQSDPHHLYYPRKRNCNDSDPGTPNIAET